MNFNSTETLKFLKFYKQKILKDIIGWNKSKQNAIKLRFKKLETFFWKQKTKYFATNIKTMTEMRKDFQDFFDFFLSKLMSYCDVLLWCLFVMLRAILTLQVLTVFTAMCDSILSILLVFIIVLLQLIRVQSFLFWL